MDETVANMRRQDIFVHPLSVNVSHHPEVQTTRGGKDMNRSPPLKCSFCSRIATKAPGPGIWEWLRLNWGWPRTVSVYQVYRCHACGRVHGRIENLNAHTRSDHAALSHGTIAAGIQECQVVYTCPCRFCQTPSAKSHVCPIWYIQMPVCSMIHEGPCATFGQNSWRTMTGMGRELWFQTPLFVLTVAPKELQTSPIDL